MAVPVEIDVETLKCEIRKTYAGVAAEPEADFIFERIESGNLVETYARSKFEDTREKALEFGARGTTVKAYKARR